MSYSHDANGGSPASDTSMVLLCARTGGCFAVQSVVQMETHALCHVPVWHLELDSH